MKLLTFKEEHYLKLGLKTSKGIIDVEKAAKHYQMDVPHHVEELFENDDHSASILYELEKKVLSEGFAFLEEADITYGPAIPNPGKIVCIGLNYRKHAEESKMAIPKYPILFNKFNNAIAASGDEIVLPFNSTKIDYEGELTIVIGKRAKRVTKEEANDYIFGYTVANDLSARDLQFRSQQWLLGKSLDGFAPVGPYIITKDEIDDPKNLTIRTYVNNEVRQDSNTSDMIFDLFEIISYVSEHMTLEPGDIILTGTPEGVMMGYPEEQQVWLKNGDIVTVEIEKLGKLTNRMIMEK